MGEVGEETERRGLFDLRDRVALITGAAQGLGFEIAEELARAGAHVILNGRQAQRLESAAARIRGKGGTASPLAFDIADPGEVAQGFERIEAAFGALDVLVSNVGIRHRLPLAEITPEDFQTVKAAFAADVQSGRLSEEALDEMDKAEAARLVEHYGLSQELRTLDALHLAVEAVAGLVLAVLLLLLGD